jgi:RimJ/RimL family protein N-acetyltransferase
MALAVQGGRGVKPWRTTARLALSAITEAHGHELHELDSDPRVMRYIGHGGVRTRDDVDATLARVLRAYALYPGLGTWRASRRDSGDFVGWVALKSVPGTVEVEVGYRLRHAAWGKGFATEGSRALVAYGFDELGLHRIIGITHPENVASQHVLVKAGLVEAGFGHYYGRRVCVYEAVRMANWRPTWRA